MLAYNPENMTEDEREHLLSTVGQAHAGLSEVALKLRWGLPPKTPVLKTAIKAERAAFDLKRSLQRCFRHQLLLPHPYLVLTKPLRLDIQCQRAASVKIGWKYLDD